jgi:immune inhibitor A
VTSVRNTPHSGKAEWWSGFGNDMTSTLSRSVDLTSATSASVSAYVQGGLEVDYDYLYGEVSADNGATWAPVGDPIDGTFEWSQKSWDLSAWAGKNVQFRFRVTTDGGVASEAYLDDIAVTINGTTTVDDVESGAGAWTAKGFSVISGTTSRQVQDMYLAENRVYSGYDDTLRTGPYNFGWASTKPDWVERFPYQNGMLVWFANGEFDDNNTIDHPGGGQVLPVDARPDPVTFHKNGIATEVPSSPAIPRFDDSDPNRYWTSDNSGASTKVAGSGTTMSVVKTVDGGNELQVMVKFK